MSLACPGDSGRVACGQTEAISPPVPPCPTCDRLARFHQISVTSIRKLKQMVREARANDGALLKSLLETVELMESESAGLATALETHLRTDHTENR